MIFRLLFLPNIIRFTYFFMVLLILEGHYQQGQSVAARIMIPPSPQFHPNISLSDCCYRLTGKRRIVFSRLSSVWTFGNYSYYYRKSIDISELKSYTIYGHSAKFVFFAECPDKGCDIHECFS